MIYYVDAHDREIQEYAVKEFLTDFNLELLDDTASYAYDNREDAERCLVYLPD